jgi:hypothetical protein
MNELTWRCIIEHKCAMLRIISSIFHMSSVDPPFTLVTRFAYHLFESATEGHGNLRYFPAEVCWIKSFEYIQIIMYKAVYEVRGSIWAVLPRSSGQRGCVRVAIIYARHLFDRDIHNSQVVHNTAKILTLHYGIIDFTVVLNTLI